MAAKLSPVEQAILALGRVQLDLLKAAAEGALDQDRIFAIGSAIDENVAVLRRTFARVQQAARGELNGDLE